MNRKKEAVSGPTFEENGNMKLVPTLWFGFHPETVDIFTSFAHFIGLGQLALSQDRVLLTNILGWTWACLSF